jgi:hypothetical protein
MSAPTSGSRTRPFPDQGQLEDAVPNIPVLGEVGAGSVLAIRHHDLIHRASFRKLGVQAHAELARTTRTGIATFDDGWIDVFHWLGSIPQKWKHLDYEQVYRSKANLES